jgi:integrase
MALVPTRVLRLRRRRDGYYATSWVRENGKRHQKIFGKEFSSAEVRFARFHVEWRTKRAVRDPDGKESLTISAAWERYGQRCANYYRRDDGTPTGETENLADALRPVVGEFGALPCGEFGPKALKMVREGMISSGLCVSTINARINRIRRMFRWLAGEELIAAEIWHGLQAVEPLLAGRCAARAAEPVRPVPEEHIEAVLGLAPPTVAAMIRLQNLTGMRPGEVCALRPVDLELGSAVWIYRPRHHKTLHRRIGRAIVFGPHAQEVIRPFLQRDINMPAFRPAEAMKQRWAACRMHRAKSCENQNGGGRKGHLGDRYTPKAYARCVARLCDRAGIPGWSPNRLRHNFATRIRREFDLELASIALGHTSIEVTQVYAERDFKRLVKVMESVG